MKGKLFLLFALLAGCNSGDQQTNTETKTNTVTQDTVTIEQKEDNTIVHEPEVKPPTAPYQSKTYSNERFKDVTVNKTGDHEFLIQGKGQIFEANFSWVIEDGHEELKQGHTMTDAGAPEWGNFSFTVNAPKKRANSTLHLVLFESSAQDGSRQYELPVLLY